MTGERTVPRQRAARENSLVDQDAEGGLHHSLLPCAQPAAARRRSLGRRRRGGGGRGGGRGRGGETLGRHPGDDGFFHAGDDHGVPQPSQPSETASTCRKYDILFLFKDNLTCGFTDTHLTIACVLFGTTGQDRKSCGPSKASWVPRRDRQALSCCHT